MIHAEHAGFSLPRSLLREEASPGQWYLPKWAVPDDGRAVLVRRTEDAEPVYFVTPLSVFFILHPKDDPSVVWTEIPL